MTSKPEWVRPTPRDNYAKGTHDAAIYARRDLGAMLEPPATPMRRDFGFWAGIVAQAYGIHLEPPGRSSPTSQ